jgi:hypothetical protein
MYEEGLEAIILVLDIEDALTLGELLTMVRQICEEHAQGKVLLDGFAYRLLNSAIDPILSHIEEGLAEAEAL